MWVEYLLLQTIEVEDVVPEEVFAGDVIIEFFLILLESGPIDPTNVA